LLGDASGNRCGGDAPRLRVADEPGATTAGGRADLRQLGRLPRTRFAAGDDDAVTTDRLGGFVAAGRNPEGGGKAQRSQRWPGRALRRWHETEIIRPR